MEGGLLLKASIKQEFQRILACPKCLGELNFNAQGAECRPCGERYGVKDRTIYFAAIEGDIQPDGIEYAKDKTSWSAFKRKNYEFLQAAAGEMNSSDYILDVGAGPGFFEDVFREFGNYIALDFFDYPGIDIVSNIVKDNLPVRPASFDCVILSNVLEHVNDPEAVLRECFRVLRSEGKILIITPFFFKLHQEPYDYYRYTHHKLLEMLNQAGFREIQIEKMGTIKDVLDGVRYEFNHILRSRCKYLFFLSQFLRAQHYLDSIINSLFLKLSEEELTQQDIFVGFSCSAKKFMAEP